MNRLNNLWLGWLSTSLLGSVVLFGLATWPVQAAWTPEACYVRLTNSVAMHNPNTPLKYFKVIRSNGSWGPVLTNRDQVLPLLFPGDQVVVRVDVRYNVKFTTKDPGPLNPTAPQAYPTGNQ